MVPHEWTIQKYIQFVTQGVLAFYLHPKGKSWGFK